MTTLSDRILAQNGDVLGQMLGHEFVRRIAEGRLSADAYGRYLVYEGAFVETAISIFAYATAKAPNLAVKRWLVAVQQELASEQMTYFERTFAELGIDADIPVPREVTAFDGGMLEIAREGDFLEIVAAMFAAEWMYWTWCSRAAGADIADPHIRQWIDLHANEAFAAQARWLKDTIDRHGGPADLDRLSAVFRHVTELEIAFHDAPISAHPERTDA
jgi:thiaminase/transcriptional activator TenA